MPICHAETREQHQKRQELESLLASAAKMLPAVQQGLVTGPQTSTAPPLALAQTTALPQVWPASYNTVIDDCSNDRELWSVRCLKQFDHSNLAKAVAASKFGVSLLASVVPFTVLLLCLSGPVVYVML